MLTSRNGKTVTEKSTKTETNNKHIKNWKKSTGNKLKHKLKNRNFNIPELTTYKNESTKRDKILASLSSEQMSLLIQRFVPVSFSTKLQPILDNVAGESKSCPEIKDSNS